MVTDTAQGKTSPVEQAQMQIHDHKAQHSYANFCRVIGTPEELIVDFALNVSPTEPAKEALDVSQRIIVNYYTAKRLLAALQISLQRHESAFGNVETDIQRRVVTNAARHS